MTRFRIGDPVLVPWGLAGEVKGRIVDVWGDPPQHVRVELDLKDDDDTAPTVILLRASVVRAA